MGRGGRELCPSFLMGQQVERGRGALLATLNEGRRASGARTGTIIYTGKYKAEGVRERAVGVLKVQNRGHWRVRCQTPGKYRMAPAGLGDQRAWQ